jgi:hypothetical protein
MTKMSFMPWTASISTAYRRTGFFSTPFLPGTLDDLNKCTSARQVTALVKSAPGNTVRLSVRTPGIREVRIANLFLLFVFITRFELHQAIIPRGSDGLLGFRFKKSKQEFNHPYDIIYIPRQVFIHPTSARKPYLLFEIKFACRASLLHPAKFSSKTSSILWTASMSTTYCQTRFFCNCIVPTACADSNDSIFMRQVTELVKGVPGSSVHLFIRTPMNTSEYKKLDDLEWREWSGPKLTADQKLRLRQLFIRHEARLTKVEQKKMQKLEISTLNSEEKQKLKNLQKKIEDMTQEDYMELKKLKPTINDKQQLEMLEELAKKMLNEDDQIRLEQLLQWATSLKQGELERLQESRKQLTHLSEYENTRLEELHHRENGFKSTMELLEVSMYKLGSENFIANETKPLSKLMKLKEILWQELTEEETWEYEQLQKREHLNKVTELELLWSQAKKLLGPDLEATLDELQERAKLGSELCAEDHKILQMVKQQAVSSLSTDEQHIKLKTQASVGYIISHGDEYRKLAELRQRMSKKNQLDILVELAKKTLNADGRIMLEQLLHWTASLKQGELERLQESRKQLTHLSEYENTRLEELHHRENGFKSKLELLEVTMHQQGLETLTPMKLKDTLWQQKLTEEEKRELEQLQKRVQLQNGLPLDKLKELDILWNQAKKMLGSDPEKNINDVQQRVNWASKKFAEDHKKQQENVEPLLISDEQTKQKFEVLMECVQHLGDLRISLLNKEQTQLEELGEQYMSDRFITKLESAVPKQLEMQNALLIESGSALSAENVQGLPTQSRWKLLNAHEQNKLVELKLRKQGNPWPPLAPALGLEQDQFQLRSFMNILDCVHQLEELKKKMLVVEEQIKLEELNEPANLNPSLEEQLEKDQQRVESQSKTSTYSLTEVKQLELLQVPLTLQEHNQLKMLDMLECMQELEGLKMSARSKLKPDDRNTLDKLQRRFKLPALTDKEKTELTKLNDLERSGANLNGDEIIQLEKLQKQAKLVPILSKLKHKELVELDEKRRETLKMKYEEKSDVVDIRQQLESEKKELEVGEMGDEREMLHEMAKFGRKLTAKEQLRLEKLKKEKRQVRLSKAQEDELEALIKLDKEEVSAIQNSTKGRHLAETEPYKERWCIKFNSAIKNAPNLSSDWGDSPFVRAMNMSVSDEWNDMYLAHAYPFLYARKLRYAFGFHLWENFLILYGKLGLHLVALVVITVVIVAGYRTLAKCDLFAPTNSSLGIFATQVWLLPFDIRPFCFLFLSVWSHDTAKQPNDVTLLSMLASSQAWPGTCLMSVGRVADNFTALEGAEADEFMAVSCGPSGYLPDMAEWEKLRNLNYFTAPEEP